MCTREGERDSAQLIELIIIHEISITIVVPWLRGKGRNILFLYDRTSYDRKTSGLVDVEVAQNFKFLQASLSKRNILDSDPKIIFRPHSRAYIGS